MVWDWRRQGIIVMSYLDDFVVMAPDCEALQQIHDTVITLTLDRLGWLREPTKGEWELTQCAEVLGLVVDLGMGLLRVPEPKVEALEGLCLRNVCDHRTRRQLAELVGSVTAVSRAALVLHLYLHSVYQLIGHNWRGWNRRVLMDVATCGDIAWIGSNIRLVAGSPLWRPSHVMVFQTDACDTGWGACIPKVGLQARGAFMVDELAWPIHHKEMKAVKLAVEMLGHYVAGWWVEFESDNIMVVVYLCDGGGPDLWMTDVMWRVWLRAVAKGCGVYNVQWIHGSMDNREADWLSHYSNTNNWELSWDIVAELEQQFGGWDVDHFTNNLNAKAPCFNSLFGCPGVEAVDAFTQLWSGMCNLLVLPVLLIAHVLAHLVEAGVMGILVDWWLLLLLVSVWWHGLGHGSDFARRGLSGVFKLGQRHEWLWEAHEVNRSQAQSWRS
ncbi:uncharacterized protein ACA1_362880 [Acanthamoeba castellanii str. Neff]|uniref:Reverse transcriptase domain-containing protein n=1 Tax=Acanthamoeba castellanii (strain ATCC 30010 / Neff) TaxID=1257118 RepID=L8GHY5_ACACF|nr:uncharacterized protein ACA1_362880 [Acanthamoeba castellanii str. Neff]ELR11801.1 hypothetical protein ACA1_362880 [Acanthamoeba castellanii str. Neff]